MKKVVINRSYGNFDKISLKGVKRLCELRDISVYLFDDDFLNGKTTFIPLEDDGVSEYFYALDVPNPNDYEHDNEFYMDHMVQWCLTDNREDIHLIQMVEELGKDASMRDGDFVIVEIPDDVKYEIVCEHGEGPEVIHEKHRTWEK